MTPRGDPGEEARIDPPAVCFALLVPPAPFSSAAWEMLRERPTMRLCGSPREDVLALRMLV